MELNGEPFVPPICPTPKYGEFITLSPDQFDFIVLDSRGSSSGRQPATELLGYFVESGSLTEENDEGNSVETCYVGVPQHSDTARYAHIIRDNENAMRRAGALFCERVTHCRGIIDGECWALGARAVIEVVREVGKT